MTSSAQPRIAVVHEWLIDYAGSERVLREILDLYPQADLFTLIDARDDELRAAIPRPVRATSFLQSFPKPRRWLRYYVPLMPLAIEQFDLTGYDIVISSSHAVAKGVITGPAQLHLSYVHTPMRYAWDLQHEYLRGVAGKPELAAILRDVIDVFDRVWYGFQSMDEKAFAHYARRVEQLRQQR